MSGFFSVSEWPNHGILIHGMNLFYCIMLFCIYVFSSTIFTHIFFVGGLKDPNNLKPISRLSLYTFEKDNHTCLFLNDEGPKLSHHASCFLSSDFGEFLIVIGGWTGIDRISKVRNAHAHQAGNHFFYIPASFLVRFFSFSEAGP